MWYHAHTHTYACWHTSWFLHVYMDGPTYMLAHVLFSTSGSAHTHVNTHLTHVHVDRLYIWMFKPWCIHRDVSASVMHNACEFGIPQDKWGICYFRSQQLASFCYEKEVRFHNDQVAVFRQR